MKRFRLIAVVGLLSFIPSLSSAQEVRLAMPVPSNCGKIVEANKSELPGAHYWWALGSLSTRAVGAYADDQEFQRKWKTIIDNKKLETVEGAIITYCQRYPLRSLSDATLDVYIQLGGKLWK